MPKAPPVVWDRQVVKGESVAMHNILKLFLVEDLNDNLKLSLNVIITYFVTYCHKNPAHHHPKAPGYALATIASDDMTT